MFYDIGTVIVTSGFYWISAGLYAIMDFTQKPAFFMKYKIQPTKNSPPDTKRLLKVTLLRMMKNDPLFTHLNNFKCDIHFSLFWGKLIITFNNRS